MRTEEENVCGRSFDPSLTELCILQVLAVLFPAPCLNDWRAVDASRKSRAHLCHCTYSVHGGSAEVRVPPAN